MIDFHAVQEKEVRRRLNKGYTDPSSIKNGSVSMETINIEMGLVGWLGFRNLH
jgi:hypothetical protein